MKVDGPPAEGAEVLTDDGYCFGCGPKNPIGLRLEFGWDDASGDYITRYTPSREHQGWEGRAHGGLVALVFDEVLSRVVLATEGLNWVTAELTTRLAQPVWVGETLLFRARVVSKRSRLIISSGEAYTEKGKIVARGTAKMMPVFRSVSSQF
ncbi:MAG TPA: PaaI family thioesterase [Capsulimonadaceae bacterium]|nr:PaaI family thioesterase [Capsulimonadaceae bacterium]